MFDLEYNILSLRPHLTKTKQDQALQVMYMVKFGPTVLNFGFDFFLLVPFLGTYKLCKETRKRPPVPTAHLIFVHIGAPELANKGQHFAFSLQNSTLA